MHFFILGKASYVAGKLYSFENFFLIISHVNSYEKNEINIRQVLKGSSTWNKRGKNIQTT